MRLQHPPLMSGGFPCRRIRVEAEDYESLVLSWTSEADKYVSWYLGLVTDSNLPFFHWVSGKSVQKLSS